MKNSQPATLDDVAALAEVSAKTVSRVANEEPGVKASTRERVLRAIELLDYKPNLNARVLAGDRSFLIGLFCDKPGDYLTDFQAGAVERCRESGYHLMVEPWDRDSPGVARQVNALLQQLRLDGVILLPPLSDDRLICSTLRDAGMPMVRIAPRVHATDSPSIGINDYMAARQLTSHLIELGHTRIGFLLGRPGHGATEERYRGFTDEMGEHGLSADPAIVGTGNFVFSDGAAAAERLLSASDPPSAIFASNDDMAAAVISVAHRMDLELPRDLSVVGFDDAPVATMIWPLLTTIRQPVATMARHAAGLIIEHSPRRRGWPQPLPHLELDFELMMRDSTSPARQRRKAQPIARSKKGNEGDSNRNEEGMSCRTTSWHASVPRRPYAQILCLLVLSCTGLAPAATPGSPTPQPTVHPRSWPPAASPAALTDSATEATVQALLAQLSLEEKVGQTIQADINSITPDDLKRYPLGSIEAGGNSSPGHDERAPAPAWVALLREFRAANRSYWGNRRAVPIIFGIDAVHGHSNIVGATIFPHNVGLGAAGDAALIRRIGEITALEVAATGADWTYAPTVTVPRDDRWGRSYEGYSSEPRIVAQYAREITLGLQGVLPLQGPIKPGRIVGTAKHFLADGGTENGQDQGDAKISEGELIRIHAAGYPPAIDAGVMTVMTSFSSWNGVKHAGNRSLITDVLKGRMGFMGFVIDDWNAHGQISGCSNDSCPEAMNAGIDMYMAPSDWKSLYVNLIQQVRSGVIAQARLDDAVRRILRVKVKAGLLRAERPLEGRYELLGAQAHRAVARQAVRESLVLLKNDQVLPIRGDAHVLVTGDGADDIGKQCGGWTISWQGTGNTNADFPHGQSIFAGIAQALSAGGGNAVLSPDGSFTNKPDVAIVVFGEDPYAEFQGDLPTLHYKPGDDRDLNLLRRLKSQGVRTVAVFLSGRPLWVNREINASDAFVAAWLPGTEGGGIADVLVGDAHGKARFDFRGRLARNWPRHPTRASLQLNEPSDPLFAYGYGLSYATPALVSKLDEGGAVLSRSGGDVFFDAGRFQEGARAVLHDAGGERPAEAGAETVSPHGVLTMHAADADAQENARELRWSGAEPASLELTGPRRDLSRQSNGDMAIALLYHLLEAPSKPVSLGMACGEGCRGRVDITPYLRSATVNKPQTMKIKLSCLAHQGIDMTRVDEPLVLETSGALRLLVRKVWLTSNEGDAICPSGVH